MSLESLECHCKIYPNLARCKLIDTDCVTIVSTYKGVWIWMVLQLWTQCCLWHLGFVKLYITKVCVRMHLPRAVQLCWSEVCANLYRCRSAFLQMSADLQDTDLRPCRYRLLKNVYGSKAAAKPLKSCMTVKALLSWMVRGNSHSGKI